MGIAISIQEKLHPVLPFDRTYRINSLCIEVNIFSIPGHLHLFKIVSTRLIGINSGGLRLCSGMIPGLGIPGIIPINYLYFFPISKIRSEERREGKECCITVSSRWSQ